MLPDPILPTPEDDIARILANFEKRLSHLERLENFESGIGARVFNSANILIANAAATALTFDTERFDTDNIHSTAINTGRLTAQTAGVYAISGSARFDANGTGRRNIQIRINGTQIDFVSWRNSGAGVGTEMDISTHWEMAVDDFAELFVRQDSGGNLNITRTADSSPEFMMQKIG